jgi:hypothetical protein
MYYKMCEKATEIQALRDMYWDNNSFSSPSQFAGKSIWLPRQDQLQDMIEDNYFGFLDQDNQEVPYELGLMEAVNDFSWTQPGDWSTEMIWLAFAMKRYKKIWNGEDWIEQG